MVVSGVSQATHRKDFILAKSDSGGSQTSGPMVWMTCGVAVLGAVIVGGLLWRPYMPSAPPVAETPIAATPQAATEPPPPIVPPPPTAVVVKLAKSIDLLDKIDIQNDVKLGAATLQDGALATSEKHVRTLVSIPVDLPAQYELEMLVTRVAGSDGFILGLNLDSQPCMLTIDGWPTVGGPWATLHQLDDQGPSNADFPGVRYAGSLLKPSQQARVQIKVDGLKYDLRVDDLPILYGDATGHTLSRPKYYNDNAYEQHPFVASYESHFTIESMTLRVP